MKQFAKRMLVLLLCAVMVLGMIPATASAADTEITLWTYPIGAWSSQEATYNILRWFERENPGIKVKIEFLNYMDGDMKLDTAIAGGQAPDLIMEGPERLVSMLGGRGLMVELNDLLDTNDVNEIYPNALTASLGRDGGMYMYPFVGTAHSMAINKTVFEAAGAMVHINEKTHTWKSTQDFFQAVQKVYDYTCREVGAIYCRGQGGDQGTRALVTNLYGGSYTNAAHTAYTWNTSAINNALKSLYDCEGIYFDSNIVGGDEIALFYNNVLNMAFCWNIAQQLNPNNANTGSGKTANGDEIMIMAFPSVTTPQLAGGVWGLGVFDNGNSAKIAAAKKFVKFICDSEATDKAVEIANYFPVRSSAGGESLANVWDSDPIMKEYGNTMMPLLGDCYQVTPNWSVARTCWWNMLQQVGDGMDIPTATAAFCAEANAGIQIDPLPLRITVQPKSVSVLSGAKASVSFKAIGEGLTYTWYYKDSGASKFSKTTAFTSNTYEVTMNEARNGRQVYCLVKDASGKSVKTNVVTLSMKKAKPATIVTEPKSVWVAEGATAKVTVKAEGDGLTYKWYYKNPGESKYTYTSTFKGNSYSITMNEARDGRYVYCKVTDKYGNTVKSKTVSLNMQTPLKIVQQPTSVKVASGKTAKVTVKAQGDGLTYEWYFKSPGASKYTYTDSFKGNSYSITMNASRSGRYVYCKITDKYGNTVKTNTVSLKLK